MSASYALEGFAVPAGLEELHGLIERAAAEHPEVGSTDLVLFETAVIEIAGNVVEHGRPDGAVTWWFRLEISADALAATLSDSGEAFDQDLERSLPDDPLADSGRGLALARAALDELAYHRSGDTNHWRMVRHRHA